jgi:hypothetical protein
MRILISRALFILQEVLSHRRQFHDRKFKLHDLLPVHSHNIFYLFFDARRAAASGRAIARPARPIQTFVLIPHAHCFASPSAMTIISEEKTKHALWM